MWFKVMFHVILLVFKFWFSIFIFIVRSFPLSHLIYFYIYQFSTLTNYLISSNYHNSFKLFSILNPNPFIYLIKSHLFILSFLINLYFLIITHLSPVSFNFIVHLF